MNRKQRRAAPMRDQYVAAAQYVVVIVEREGRRQRRVLGPFDQETARGRIRTLERDDPTVEAWIATLDAPRAVVLNLNAGHGEEAEDEHEDRCAQCELVAILSYARSVAGAHDENTSTGEWARVVADNLSRLLDELDDRDLIPHPEDQP